MKQFVRRVHAFMHPSMPQEPLVILHCALQHGAAASMKDILHPHQMQLAPPAATSEFLHQCTTHNSCGSKMLIQCISNMYPTALCWSLGKPKSVYAAYKCMHRAAAAFLQELVDPPDSVSPA